jgi:hypothetical protein
MSRYSRRRFLLSSAASAAPMIGQQRSAPTRPNILLILADDLAA